MSQMQLIKTEVAGAFWKKSFEPWLWLGLTLSTSEPRRSSAGRRNLASFAFSRPMQSWDAKY
jgi:hypothetical protein